MRQPLYIKSAVAISAQESFEREKFLQPLLTSGTGKLFAQDAPYAQYISPVAIRRMSRQMKMTISCAMEALVRAGVATPDAIITGTGRGGVTDMEHFVKDMILLNEGAMNPTAFIQSTYNSASGWIAMQAKCTGYNQTYVHRGCSFELAVQDAQMLAGESELPINLLVGCFDELTEDYYHIRQKRGYWKIPAISSESLYQHEDVAGTIAGEGASFFVLSNQPEEQQNCLRQLKIIYQANAEKITQAIMEVAIEEAIGLDAIDLILLGDNGDPRQQHLYAHLDILFPKTRMERFKHLCGEFDTATGFGTWYADWILHQKQADGKQPKNLLLINHYILGSATVMFITAPETT
ncbi:MAG: beta-ketoacyl synthase chain length factor [Bacteroidetes bacterium]|nr:beta-ketoacyl synthase chain length factor [Bacteroidota bacterium]